MKTAPEHLIYESVFEANILPLTSVCNVRCIFCSHRQNPPGTEIFSIPHLPREKVQDLLEYISPGEKIVIGESVTRIIEGEPFTHPEIKEILYMIRERFPNTDILITTNGSLVDLETARFLAGLGRVQVNLSLNSAAKEMRKMMMADDRAEAAIKAGQYLADQGVTYHGSVVAMPHITGWEDLGETVRYLSETGAHTIRVFLPGFTYLASKKLEFAPNLSAELSRYINSLADELLVPVTLEPSMVSDLAPIVEGVIRESPASAAGILKNDVIVTVNGKECFSRVDAFEQVRSLGPVRIELNREGQGFSFILDKKPGQTSGLVMTYDISPQLVDRICQVASRYRGAYLLCSGLAKGVLEKALAKTHPGGHLDNIKVVPVRSRFFGGSIAAAGLLLATDFIAAIRETIPKEEQDSAAIFLPSAAFDRQGRDLAGNSWLDIEEAAGCKVEII